MQQVGLFGRQSSIDLSIPKWVTIFISNGVYNKQTSHLLQLIKGLATVGVLGVTVVTDRASSEWNYFTEEVTKEDFSESRPFFKVVTCNKEYFNQNPSSVMSGLNVVLCGSTFDENNVVTQHFFYPVDGDVLLIDITRTLVGWTNNPLQLLTDLSADPSLPTNPESLPHWMETEMGVGILHRMTILLAINALCKPDRFTMNSFVFASEFTDEVVARAINERGLRPLWEGRSKRKSPAKAFIDQASLVEDPIIESVIAPSTIND